MALVPVPVVMVRAHAVICPVNRVRLLVSVVPAVLLRLLMLRIMLKTPRALIFVVLLVRSVLEEAV